MSLFVTITAMSSTSIITIIDAAGQSRASGQALNSISFAVEDFVRNVRLGSKYYCMDDEFIEDADPTDLADREVNDCNSANAGWGLGFVGSDKTTLYVYYIDEGEFIKGSDSANPFLPQNTVPLLPPGIELKSLDVVVQGAEDPSQGDYRQPHVQLMFEFTYEYREVEIPIRYKTSVTSRSLDTI